MVHESILVINSLEETEQFLKEIIPQINGKIKNISEDEYSIEWSYLYGLQTIWCETKLIPNKKGIEIFSIADSSDIYKTGAKKALENLYIALSQRKNITFIESEIKPESKPQPSQRTKESNTKYWLMGIIGFIIFLMIIPTDFGDNNKNIGSNNIRTTKYGYYAAYNEETLKKAIRYAHQQDTEAFAQLMMYGEIFKIPEGVEVHLLDLTFNGTVKIRIRGTTEEIWTIREALNK